MTRTHLSRIASALAVAFVLALLATPASAAPRSGSTTWGPWSFSWTVGDEKEGLEIKSVFFNGVKVLHKGSMPVVRVKYVRDGGIFDRWFSSGCGPYQDRMKWGNMKKTSCQDEKICQREYGGQVLELGAFSQIGEYDLYQAWYFDRAGRLEARLWSRGWSCELTHRHHPYWRLDFDVDGTRNEVYRFRKSSPSVVFPDEWTEYERETNEATPSGRTGVGWWIANTTSRRYVTVRPVYTEPSDSFSTKDVGVRRYHYSEDEGWEFGAGGSLGYLDNEYLWGADNVFWWVGHLGHAWIDGVDEEGLDWHWTGPKIYVGWD